jgi:hypothetical protein
MRALSAKTKKPIELQQLSPLLNVLPYIRGLINRGFGIGEIADGCGSKGASKHHKLVTFAASGIRLGLRA